MDNEHQSWVHGPINYHTRLAAAASYERNHEHNGYNLVKLNLETRCGDVWLRKYDTAGGGWIPRVIANRTNNHGRWKLSQFLKPNSEDAKTYTSHSKPESPRIQETLEDTMPSDRKDYQTNRKLTPKEITQVYPKTIAAIEQIINKDKDLRDALNKVTPDLITDDGCLSDNAKSAHFNLIDVLTIIDSSFVDVTTDTSAWNRLKIGSFDNLKTVLSGLTVLGD